jgi:hypothetical protein
LGGGKKEDEIARNVRDNFEKQWRNYQSLSSYERRVQRKGIGILRDAKSGKEFHEYVKKQMTEAHSTGDEEVCARNIMRELMKDPRYLVHAVKDSDGRKGVSILTDDYRGDENLRGTIRTAMSKEEKQFGDEYQKTFDQNFQRYSQDFKKEVEGQGQYQVDRVYYIRRDLPGNREKFNEIRAEIRPLVAKQETKQGEVERIFSSKKKDVRVAVFDRMRGDFVPEDYMYRKDKPLEKTFADWVAEDALTLGIGTIARATGRVLVEGSKIVAKGISKTLTKDVIEGTAKKVSTTSEQVVAKGLGRGMEKFSTKEGVKRISGRAAREDASRSLSEAVTRERVRARGVSEGVRDTAQDMGDTFDLSKFERKLSAGTPPPARKLPTTQPLLPPRRLPTTQPLRADVYSEGTIDFIGKDVAEKAVKIGIDEKHLGTMIWQAEARGMLKKPAWAAEAYEWGYLPRGGDFFPSVSKATRETVRRDIQATYSLGENMARKLILYGHDPYDISRMIDASAAEGLTANEIRQQFANELKLMNYYRETFHPGLRTLENAKAALTPSHSAPGDAYVNIRSAIFQRLVNNYKRRLDAAHGRPSVWDELPAETTSTIFLNLHQTAEKMTQRMVKRLLGSTPAVIPLSALRKDRSIEEDKKRIEEEEAKKTEAKRLKTKDEKAKETEAAKVKELEAAKAKRMEEAEEKRVTDELRLTKSEGDVPTGKYKDSEIEREAKREKERLEEIRKGPPRSPQEEAGRAQEEVAQTEALLKLPGGKGLKVLQDLRAEEDARYLAEEKAEADEMSAWAEEYEQWKNGVMEEFGLSEEEFEKEFGEMSTDEEGQDDLLGDEDPFGDDEESGYGGESEGDDEGGFGEEDQAGPGGEYGGDEDKGEKSDDGTDKEKKGKDKSPGAGKGGGESDGGGGGSGGSGGGG